MEMDRQDNADLYSADNGDLYSADNADKTLLPKCCRWYNTYNNTLKLKQTCKTCKNNQKYC